MYWHIPLRLVINICINYCVNEKNNAQMILSGNLIRRYRRTNVRHVNDKNIYAFCTQRYERRYVDILILPYEKPESQ